MQRIATGAAALLFPLTPVPADALAQDAHLRDALGAPDVRYLLAVRGATAEEALQRVEALHPKLDDLIARKAIAGYDSAARVLPSAATQRARQATLPASETLRASLDAAVAAAARDSKASAGAEPVVLLSPACASYDQFRNFEVRGDAFRQLIEAIPGVVMRGAS